MKKKISTVKNPESPKGKWECMECHKVLSSRDSLLRHIGWVHNAPYTQLDRKKKTGTPVYNREDLEDE